MSKYITLNVPTVVEIGDKGGISSIENKSPQSYDKRYLRKVMVELHEYNKIRKQLKEDDIYEL